MKTLTLSLMLAGTMALTGCSDLASLNPFVSDEQATMDPMLAGTWTNADGKDIYWIRKDDNGNGYTIRYVSDSSGVTELKARLLVEGDVRILDVTAGDTAPFQVPVHAVVRVWMQDSTLRFAFLQTDWIKEQARGKLATSNLATAPLGSGVLITAPGEAVRSFLVKAAADPQAGDEPETLHRVQ